jgi:hypothetical protein
LVLLASYEGHRGPLPGLRGHEPKADHSFRRSIDWLGVHSY